MPLPAYRPTCTCYMPWHSITGTPPCPAHSPYRLDYNPSWSVTGGDRMWTATTVDIDSPFPNQRKPVPPKSRKR